MGVIAGTRHHTRSVLFVAPVMLSTPIDRKAATAAAAIGLIALGVISLVYGDLLLQWQPAPTHASWRIPVAYLSGAILLIAGLGLFVARLRRAAAVLGSLWIALWVLVLHLPLAIAARGNVAAMLGVAECSAMALGIGMLALGPDARRYRRALVAGFGICALIFGLSHFVYADFTAQMVPDWLPSHLGVAYLTGAVHALTGLCMLFGFVMPLAAWIEAMMMCAFVVLLHVPGVLAAPTDRLQWTMLAIATTLTSAAWLVAASTRGGVRTHGSVGLSPPFTA